MKYKVRWWLNINRKLNVKSVLNVVVHFLIKRWFDFYFIQCSNAKKGGDLATSEAKQKVKRKNATVEAYPRSQRTRMGTVRSRETEEGELHQLVNEIKIP